MEQTTADLMNQLLLPLMKHDTPEFNEFKLTLDSYIHGNKNAMIQHLERLASSSNTKIAKTAEAIIGRAKLENF